MILTLKLLNGRGRMSANTIPPEDLEVGIFPPVVRTGGMQVGTIPSGIYLLHLPTGIGIISTTERSQHANKYKALKILNKILEEM
jgi:protein subunit release factor A